LTKLILAAVALLIATACTGPDPNVTEDGEGLPVLTLEFPEVIEPGSTNDAVLTIENPGPGDFDSLVVAFSLLGDPELPAPLVDVSPPGRDGPVVSVAPEPNAIGENGVIYTFDGLPEGETMTITFELRAPAQEGKVGNAVQVYDGSDPNRARGVRLEAEVRG
jgi:hypothetical protein